MNETEIKLDRLAEFHAQKDSIETQKRALLDEVKVPAEVLRVQAEANEAAQVFASKQRKMLQSIEAECAAKLAEIQIPDKIKAALAEIDHQRGLVRAYQAAKEAELSEAEKENREKLFLESQAQTAKVYADIATRKAEIEAEFRGKAEAVDENIKRLEDEIKAEAKNARQTIKGQYFMAVYNRGRVSWNTEALDKYADQHPEVAYFRKEGDPSISIRSIK